MRETAGKETDDINKNAKEKTKNMFFQMSITLEEAYNGARKSLDIKRFRFCESCRGRGSNKKEAETKCNGCKGRGVKLIDRDIGIGIIQQPVQCNECQGNFTL